MSKKNNINIDEVINMTNDINTDERLEIFDDKFVSLVLVDLAFRKGKIDKKTYIKVMQRYGGKYYATDDK